MLYVLYLYVRRMMVIFGVACKSLRREVGLNFSHGHFCVPFSSAISLSNMKCEADK
jgi:hypothetical protein